MKCDYIKKVTMLKRLQEVKNNMSSYGKKILVIDVTLYNDVIKDILRVLSKEKDITIIVTYKNKLNIYASIVDICEFLEMPRNINSNNMVDYTNTLINKMKICRNENTIDGKLSGGSISLNEKFIVIAASTGGTEALRSILKELPQDIAPILIVQHIMSGFTKSFADLLDKQCQVKVKEAGPIENIQRGTVFIAPTDKHMRVVVDGNRLRVECFVSERIFGLMPAADVLFESVANIIIKHHLKDKVMGIILTGMGMDGAKELLRIRKSGARTIGQDENSCVVYGMPKVAFNIGAVEKQLPLNKIAREIIDFGNRSI